MSATIASVYQELLRNARRTGEARGQTLTGGARLTVRARQGWIVLTIARKGKQVGDVELQTFRRDCGVPADAIRRPAEGQSRMYRGEEPWFYLNFRWEEPEP